MRILGLDVLGWDTLPKNFRGKFDPTASYAAGDSVVYGGDGSASKFWIATRAVSPPWFTSISSGDVPGTSDAWVAVDGQTVLGAPVQHHQTGDVFDAPDRVTINTHSVVSPDFTKGQVRTATVQGGTRHHPMFGDMTLACYEFPISIVLVFANGTTKMWKASDLEFVSVKGGVQHFDVPIQVGPLMKKHKSSSMVQATMHPSGVVHMVGAPLADTTYTDRSTVLAVQGALESKGFHLQKGKDGVYGSDTARAIRAMQASIGAAQTGVIDYGVLMALCVSAPEPSAPSGSLSVTPSRSQMQPSNVAPNVVTSTQSEAASTPTWQIALGAAGAALLGYGLWSWRSR